MNNIYDCVNSFIPLLDTAYELTLGRKNKTVTLHIQFDKKDCFHLMGLQYLRDRPELRKDRGRVFDDIVNQKITKEQIESSDFYDKIADRIDLLPLLEDLFDRNDTIFKYNEKQNTYSLIQADYLMKNYAESRNVFIFLAKREDECYFCRSFFPEEKRDYSKGQASWTLLRKIKMKCSTGEKMILYNRL